MITFKEISVKKYTLSKLGSTYVNAEKKDTVGLYANKFFLVATIFQISIYVRAFKVTGECRKCSFHLNWKKIVQYKYIYILYWYCEGWNVIG